MSQFHKPRETDYYLWVPTELVVFQQPVFFFPWRDKNLFEREKDREREWAREKGREEGRETEAEPARGQEASAQGPGAH